jgi:hypothetical protein
MQAKHAFHDYVTPTQGSSAAAAPASPAALADALEACLHTRLPTKATLQLQMLTLVT